MIQGQGGLHFETIMGSRNRNIQVNSIPGMTILRFANQHAARSSVTLESTPQLLRSMRTGVKINGKPWKIGTPCFFGDGQQFGIVKDLVAWVDNFQFTLILHLQQYRVHGNGTQSWVSTAPDKPPTTIFWNELTHRCKVYEKQVNGITVQAVVRVSTTQPHMDGIDFDHHMH